MLTSADQTDLLTDRIRLTRTAGRAPSLIAGLRASRTLRPLDRGPGDRANDALFEATLDQVSAAAAFAIEIVETGDPIGLTGFSAVEPAERRVTFAPIWTVARIDEAMLVSHVAHLLTRYAFDVLAVERAETHLDWRLRRTLDLYTMLGFRCEGRLRAYFAGDGGASADAAVLSVVRREWPSLQRRQRAVLAREEWGCRLPSDRLP